jgi:hypothetical protein
MKIPQMFYLRRQTLRARTAQGVSHSIVVHVYWNYRLTVQGVIRTAHRKTAKAEILKTNPEAEFWR